MNIFCSCGAKNANIGGREKGWRFKLLSRIPACEHGCYRIPGVKVVLWLGWENEVRSWGEKGIVKGSKRILM